MKTHHAPTHISVCPSFSHRLVPNLRMSTLDSDVFVFNVLRDRNLLVDFLAHFQGQLADACQWTAHVGKYSAGFASGHSSSYSLAAAEQKCIDMGAACKAITCSNSGCTLRRSTGLETSPSGEMTYTPSSSCSKLGSAFRTCQRVSGGCARAGSHSRCT